MIEGKNGKFSLGEKKIITEDWETYFPSLKMYKVLDINNRIGPLVVGIYLKVVRGIIYIPTCYVHNLCREFPTFTSTLRRSGPSIRPFEHDKKYKEVAEELKNTAYLPLEGDLHINEIISGYIKYFTYPYKGTYTEYEDLALFCGWTKRQEIIEYALDIVYKELSTWPEERFFNDVGGFETWFKDLEKKVWDGDRLNIIFQSELTKHKAKKIPERKVLF